MQFDRAALRYRELVALRPNDDALLAEYLRVAGLTREAAVLADAAARLVERAATPGSTIDGAALTLALRQLSSVPPRLSNSAWGRVAMRLIACDEFDAAESLALKLVARDAAGDVVPKVLSRLVHALRDVGQSERAERANRLLIQRYPQVARL